ncbi:MAG: hypothetical protein ACFFFB_09830, partial [Candidatus Heimdallarchaeota archaeon]
MQTKERRVLVNLDELKTLIKELKYSKNLSLRKINDIIGTNIRNFLYGTTNSLKESSIIKLAKLVNKKINYKVIKNELSIPHLKKCDPLAELIGIILGDGSLHKSKYRVQISFNGLVDIKYVNYVKDLL